MLKAAIAIVGLAAALASSGSNPEQRELRRWSPRITNDASKDRFLRSYGPLSRAVAPRFLLHPAVLLAQAAIETGWGRSDTMVRAHALWGVKVGSYTPAEAVVRAERISRESGLRARPFSTETWGTHEEAREGRVAQRDEFRVYPDLVSGAADYADLVTRGRYARTRDVWNDPYKQLGVIWGAGYATSRRYIQTVASILEAIGAGPRPAWLDEYQTRILADRDAGRSTDASIAWMMAR